MDSLPKGEYPVLLLSDQTAWACAQFVHLRRSPGQILEWVCNSLAESSEGNLQAVNVLSGLKMDFRHSDPTLSAALIAESIFPLRYDNSRRRAFERAAHRLNIQTARASNLTDTWINHEPAAAVLALLPELRARFDPDHKPVNPRLAALDVATTLIFKQPARKYDENLYDFAQVSRSQICDLDCHVGQGLQQERADLPHLPCLRFVQMEGVPDDEYERRVICQLEARRPVDSSVEVTLATAEASTQKLVDVQTWRSVPFPLPHETNPERRTDSLQSSGLHMPAGSMGIQTIQKGR